MRGTGSDTFPNEKGDGEKGEKKGAATSAGQGEALDGRPFFGGLLFGNR